MRKRWVTYEFSDGSIKSFPLGSDEAHDYARLHDLQIRVDGARKYREANRTKRRRKDGFQPGWQPQLGREVNSRREYDQILKEEGLIEVGNETPEFQTHTKTEPTYFSDENLRDFYQSGAEISGNEGEWLQKEEISGALEKEDLADDTGAEFE